MKTIVKYILVSLLALVGLTACDNDNYFGETSLSETPTYIITPNGSKPVYQITLYRDMPMVAVWNNVASVSSYTRSEISYTEVGEYPKFSFSVSANSYEEGVLTATNNVYYMVTKTETGCTLTIASDDNPTAVTYDCTVEATETHVENDLFKQYNTTEKDSYEMDAEVAAMLADAAAEATEE